MENIIIPSLIVKILIPCEYANASPAEAELILENIKIETIHPEKGESVIITERCITQEKSVQVHWQV
jgi:hypothetical protein